MKAKIMALILAVVLGTAGIAATAQAAAGAAGECTHPNRERIFGPDVDYYYYNPQYHLITYTTWYFCKDGCNEFTEETQELEWHDYEQIYCNDGRVYTYCTGCGDSYYY